MQKLTITQLPMIQDFEHLFFNDCDDDLYNDLLVDFEFLFFNDCDDDLYNDLLESFEDLTHSMIIDDTIVYGYTKKTIHVPVNGVIYEIAISTDNIIIDFANEAIEVTPTIQKVNKIF